MTYIENRELRRKMAIEYGSRCFKNNSNDNQGIVLKICELRKERANLLKFNTHADYILE